MTYTPEHIRETAHEYGLMTAENMVDEEADRIGEVAAAPLRIAIARLQAEEEADERYWRPLWLGERSAGLV